MKIFIICQVRHADKEETARQKQHVEFYEGLGHEICWPPRDTEQNDSTGLGVCEANFRSIQKADLIHLLWSGGSDGLYFDLGIAFALGKPIQPFNLPTPYFSKAFAAMIVHYFEKYGFSGAQLSRLGELLRSSYQRTEVLLEEKSEPEASAPRDPGRSLVNEIFDYLNSHSFRATVCAEEPAEPDGTPEILVTTNMVVGGGEQEHIKNMAKGYKVVFRRFPEEEKEDGAQKPFAEIITDVTDYLSSHGIHSSVEADRYADPPTITITADIRVSGGEQEHIKNMAKGYKVIFWYHPEKEQEDGA